MWRKNLSGVLYEGKCSEKVGDYLGNLEQLGFVQRSYLIILNISDFGQRGLKAASADSFISPGIWLWLSAVSGS
jgi:hypothetical protein